MYRSSVRDSFLAFSLIELMVVIAIVALLSVVAVPAYKKYVTRAKITNIINVLQQQATKDKTYYNTNGAWDPSHGLNLPIPPGLGITAFVRDYNATGGFRPYIAALFTVDTSVLASGSGYLAFVCRVDSSNNIVCLCRTASLTEYPSASIPFEYLPAQCQCNDPWNAC